MFTSTIKDLPKSEIEITLTISADEIQKAVERIMEEVVKNAEIKGFRKGKAPKNLVEKEIDQKKVYQEALQEVLPKAYSDAINKNSLHPIVDPHIELVSPEKIEEIKDCREVVFKALTCQKPPVLLHEYKDKIKSLTAKAKIWVPGKDKTDEKKGPPKIELSDIIKTLLETVEIELPPILVQHEANRYLSQTLDEIKKLGLTLDQYLSSTGKSVENLKEEASLKAVNDLKLEFALGTIANEEKIVVSNEDLEKVITENKDPKVQENLRKQSYLLASILLQQKTLDFLKAL